jgi:hypothetical protein
VNSSTTVEQSIISVLTDMQRFTYLNRQLRIVKVFTAGAGILCLGAFLGSFFSQRLIGMAIYGVFSADLFRISYNCFIKNYICLCMSKLGGNVSKASETVLSWMTSAAGLGNKDPFAIVQNELSLEVLTANTLSKYLYRYAQNFLKDSKKYK